jgi:hypothetical protein
VARQPERDAIARERKRRSSLDVPSSSRAPALAAPTRRAAATACGWCGGVLAVKATGRIPKWCSPACRQRAWEQARAAASGRAAVQVVERLVEVPVARERTPQREEWPALLRELAAQLDDGRIYARDLPELGSALNDSAAAYNRRQNPRRLRH